MEFLQIVVEILQYGTITPSLLIFLISALLLIAGVGVKTWMFAVRLSHLEHKPLNWIEYTHPHMPSIRHIVTIALCSAVLIVMALQTVQGVFPFNDPYQGLNITSLFVLGAAVGILAELKWKGSGEYASALLAGTAIAFLFLAVLFGDTNATLSQKTVPLVLLLPSIALTSIAFSGKRQTTMYLASVLSFTFWMLVYVAQQ